MPNQRQPICFVFNTRTLIPYRIIKDLIEKDTPYKDILDAMLTWQETVQSVKGHHFEQNDEVVDINNPYQKMTVRKIIREKGKFSEEGDKKSRLLGIECYWWQEVTIDSLMQLFNNITDKIMTQGVSLMKES